MKLSVLDETRISRSLLDHLRLRLVDKSAPILPAEGKYYADVPPHDHCALGCITRRRDQDEKGSDTQVMPSSMGLSFLVEPPDSGPLVLEVSGHFDLEHGYIPDVVDQLKKATTTEKDGSKTQKLGEAFIRYTLQFDRARFEIPLNKVSDLAMFGPKVDTLNQALDEHLARIAMDPRVYRQLRRPDRRHQGWSILWSEALSNQHTLNEVASKMLFKPNSLPMRYELSLRCRVRRAPKALYANKKDGRPPYLVEVFLVNVTGDIDRSYHLDYHRVMDINLRVSLLAGTHCRMRFPIAPQEYQYEAVQEADGFGLTCALVRDPDGTLRTDSMPTYEQPRVETATAEEVGMKEPPSFMRLAKDPLPLLDDLLEAMRAYQRSWRVTLDDLQKREWPLLSQAQQDFDDSDDEIKRATAGVELLRKDRKAYRAFRLMNEAMANALKTQGRDFESWHLFQIVFILTLLPLVAARAEPLPANAAAAKKILAAESEYVEVLRNRTGSGKTEAFLGVIAFTMFWERLTERSYGPTCWQRYPLRMLSAQQFVRMVYVVAACEFLRVREQLGGFPFGVGFFTGAGTPNSISTEGEDDYLPTLILKPNWKDRFHTLSHCPYCNSPTDVVPIVEHFQILLVCTDAKCWSNRKPPNEEERHLGHYGHLGVRHTDEEVYRYGCNALIGTLDKSVVIGHNRRIAILFFGAAKFYCPDHGFTTSQVCPHKSVRRVGKGWSRPFECSNNLEASSVRLKQVNRMVRPGVSIEGHDEVNLQAEELGSYFSHYSSAFQEIQRGYPGARPSIIIAAGATLNNVQHQMPQLFMRNPRCFPAPGPQLDTNFHARVKYDPETGEPLVRRIYVGALPLTYEDKRLEDWASDANEHYHDLIEELSERLEHKPQIVCRELSVDPSKATLVLEHLHEMRLLSLIYVRRKRDGINAAKRCEADNEKRVEAGKPARKHLEIYAETPMPVVHQAVRGILRGDPDGPQQLITTSTIAYGVDFPRMNFMCMVGATSTTAEYIQASSRCARWITGIVFTMLEVTRLYEATAFAHFGAYHKFIQRLVEPVAINRFGNKVLLRTLPGIFSTLMLNWAPREPWGHGINSYARSVRDALNKGGVTDKVIEKVIRAYGLERAEELGLFDPQQIRQAKLYLTEQASLLVGFMRRLPAHLNGKLLVHAIPEMWGQGPMSSLRDVEAQVGIEAANDDARRVLEALGALSRGMSNDSPSVPHSRVFYEDHLPGGVVALKEGYAMVVGVKSNHEVAKQIDTALTCSVAIEYSTNFREDGGTVDEGLLDGLTRGEVVTHSPSTLFVIPFPLLLECSNCGYVEEAPYSEPNAQILRIKTLISHHGSRIGCPRCRTAMRQLPWVQLHGGCGHIAPLEAPRHLRGVAKKLHTRDGRRRLSWNDLEDGRQLAGAHQGPCRSCVNRDELKHRLGERNPKGVWMMAAPISGGRGRPFYPHLIEFIALTPETTKLLTQFRAVAQPAELGRAILCSLLGLQTPEQIRLNLKNGGKERLTAINASKLSDERIKLKDNILSLEKMSGMQAAVRALRERVKAMDEALTEATGLFVAADSYISKESVLHELGSNQRAAEAALIRREFKDHTLESQIEHALPEHQVLLQERKERLLSEYAVREVRYIEDKLSVVTAAIGYTRQAANPRGMGSRAALRMNPFMEQESPTPGKIPLHVLPSNSEGILLHLDPCRVLSWAVENLGWENPPDTVQNDPSAAHALILETVPLLARSPTQIRTRAIAEGNRDAYHLLGLQHTIAHLVIRHARNASGYDPNSLRERLHPADLSFVIYVSGRKTHTMGGLRTLFDFYLLNWMEQSSLASFRCIFDPVCSEMHGSCNGCCQMPLNCETFNHGLSRAYLVGGRAQDVDGRIIEIKKGFWR